MSLRSAVMLALNGDAVAAGKTTVALTPTTIAALSGAEHKRSGSLTPLLEQQMRAGESQSFVERQQIEPALQELALSRSRTADESRTLVTAGAMIMLELRHPDAKSDKRSAA